MSIQAKVGTRITLEFSPETMAHIADIQNVTGAVDTAMVVQNSLRVYEWLLAQRAAGYDLAVIAVKREVIKVVTLET